MRIVILLTTLIVGSSFAVAQGLQPAPRPQRPTPVQTGPTGEQRLLWACRQLQLDADQMAQASELLKIYKATVEAENPLAFLEEMQRLVAERDAANQRGDHQRRDEFQKRLDEMEPGMDAEQEFFENLSLILTDEQAQRLPEVRRRARTIKDIALRPVHAFIAVRAVDLTSDQRRDVEKVLAQFRTQSPALRPEEQRPTDENVEQLIRDIRAILTAEQARVYDERIAAMRVDVPEAKPVTADVRPAPAANPGVQRGASAPVQTLQAAPDREEQAVAEPEKPKE